MWKNLKIALSAVAILWLVHLIDVGLVPADLRYYGLRPRHLDGLWGILFAPFLHVNIAHLVANSGALFILLAVSLSFSRKLTFKALLAIILAGGGLVWLFGRSEAVHIGASGVIFGLIGFLMFVGIFRREWKALILSVAIFFFYGGALYSLLVYVRGTSWTGHLFGFTTGVLAAWWTRTEKIKKRR